MSPTETGMFDQPSKDTDKFAPGWRLLKLLGYGDAPSAGPGRGKTKSYTPKEPEERKRQFAIWYIFAAFLGVMLVRFCGCASPRSTPFRTANFEQLVDEGAACGKPWHLLVADSNTFGQAMTGR